tara:strand:+ start:273 stop:1805 length:1533 start_codon:yes stop_codon:yes gene_type:complete
MNDGSALTGAYTLTNASAIIQGNSSADTSEIKVGDIVIDDNGDKVRVKDIQPNRTVATGNVDTSANTIEITNHGFVANQEVFYQANGGTALAGLTDETIFFVKAVTDADKVTLSATEGGSVISLTGTGNNAQTFSGTSTKAFTATSAFGESTNSGSSCTVTRPPLSGNGSIIDATILGITAGEAVAAVDNVTSVNVGTTTLGNLETIGGNTYSGSAPSVTIAAPTARTITQANIDETTNVFTVTGHNMRDGTKLTYTSNGTNIVHSGGTLADSTAVFVRDRTENTFKLALSAGGTALDITNDGNDSNSFVGDTATGTATISGGKVTGITVTGVGSDYQSAPAVTVAAPAGSGSLNLASGSVLVAADDEIVIPSAMYAVITTGEAVTYSDGGGTAPTGLVDGTVYFLIKSGTANKMSVASTYANAVAGTKITLAAGSVAGSAHTFIGGTAAATAIRGLGEDGDSNISEISHIGWVKKTVGTGGRAGRVHYETLVAASSISGDAEDIATPDS